MNSEHIYKETKSRVVRPICVPSRKPLSEDACSTITLVTDLLLAVGPFAQTAEKTGEILKYIPSSVS